jgi:hypothetical protein
VISLYSVNECDLRRIDLQHYKSIEPALRENIYYWWFFQGAMGAMDDILKDGKAIQKGNYGNKQIKQTFMKATQGKNAHSRNKTYPLCFS